MPGRGVVEPQGVRAAHQLGGAAGASDPGPAEAVDQEVVADVGPAERLGVVAVDRPQDPAHLAPLVVVAARRVVDVHLLELVVVPRPAAAPPLVGTPVLAGVDLGAGGPARPGRPGGDLRRRRGRRTPARVGPGLDHDQARRRVGAGGAQPQGACPTDPERLGARDGRALTEVGQRLPGLPRPARKPELEVGGLGPSPGDRHQGPGGHLPARAPVGHGHRALTSPGGVARSAATPAPSRP